MPFFDRSYDCDRKYYELFKANVILAIADNLRKNLDLKNTDDLIKWINRVYRFDKITEFNKFVSLHDDFMRRMIANEVEALEGADEK